MVEKYSRAQRRQDRARLKVKRQFHWGYGHKDEWACRMPADAGDINFMSPGVAGGVIDTPTPCSCWMCGNPRRAKNSWADNRLTMQERKALEDYIDQMSDVNRICDNCNCKIDKHYVNIGGYRGHDIFGLFCIDCYEDYLQVDVNGEPVNPEKFTYFVLKHGRGR